MCCPVKDMWDIKQTPSPDSLKCMYQFTNKKYAPTNTNCSLSGKKFKKWIRNNVVKSLLVCLEVTRSQLDRLIRQTDKLNDSKRN